MGPANERAVSLSISGVLQGRLLHTRVIGLIYDRQPLAPALQRLRRELIRWEMGVEAAQAAF